MTKKQKNIKQDQGLKIPRRDFFKIAAASGATAAVASCASDPIEEFLPYINPPADLQAGEVYKFASTCQECSAGCGVHVRTVEGRVIGIEGAPNHPLNKGSLCALGQSALQRLYSPSRIKEPLVGGFPATWDEALDSVSATIKDVADSEEARVLYIGPVRKGAFSDMLQSFLNKINGRALFYEGNPYNSLVEANKSFFERAEVPFYDFSQAKTVISFGADFLESWHSVVENTRAFADFHSYRGGKKGLHVHVSPQLSLTASNADKWISCFPGGETHLALALAKHLLGKSSISQATKKTIATKLKKVDIAKISKRLGLSQKQFTNLADAFGVAGTGLAIAGGVSAANVENVALHQAVNLLNYIGGAINKTVKFGADYAFAGDDAQKIKQEVERLAAGKYDVLIIHNLNLLEVLPQREVIKNALKNVKLVAGLFDSHNETSAVCQTLLPIATSFESFDELNPKAGVYSLQQPAMTTIPGFDYRQAGDIFLELAGKLKIQDPELEFDSFQNWLKDRWSTRYYDKNSQHKTFADFWVAALQKGGIYQDVSYSNTYLAAGGLAKMNLPELDSGEKELQLVAFNSNLANINAHSGNRGWLAEIPNPISQVTWDSWVEMHPDTAIKYDINHGDEVELTSPYGKFSLPAYVYHGVHPSVVAIPAGMGLAIQFPNYSSRRNAFLPFTADKPKELITQKVGENVLDLLPFDNAAGDLLLGVSLKVKKTGARPVVAAVDGQWRDDIKALQADSLALYGDRSQKGRGLFRGVKLSEVKKGKIHHEGHHLRERHYDVKSGTAVDFYDNVDQQVRAENVGYGFKPNDNPVFHDPYRFEMVIDLDRCTGCSACVVACYVENNIPVVGKERVHLHRQMNWIRVERYFDPTDDGGVKTSIGPSTCQQCDNAGCEPVCPVYATYHNPDGLNAQVYNRCVGTRYCGNNCAYKQRRFNWRTYQFPYPLNLQLNPEVSVRSKGVMEKCTFCVQRIQKAKAQAKSEDRLVQDGEIVTACQSVCPTKAISFGNSTDKKSTVSQLKEDIRGYHQLAELNYRPAVTYLSKVVHDKTI